MVNKNQVILITHEGCAHCNGTGQMIVYSPTDNVPQKAPCIYGIDISAPESIPVMPEDDDEEDLYDAVRDYRRNHPEQNKKENWYSVEFYDDPIPVDVKTDNFPKAAILAAAERIKQGKNWGVRLVTNKKTGNYCPIELIKD